MKKMVCLSVLGVFAACSSPDVSNETKALSEVVDATVEQMGSRVAKNVSTEMDSAKFAAIEGNDQVYGASRECSKVANQPLKANVAKCQLEPKYTFSQEKGTAVYQQMALTALSSYSKTLSSLVNSEAPADIQSNFNKFLESLNSFSNAASSGDTPSVINVDHIEPLSGLAGRIADARRFAAVKQLVNDAHGPVEEILRLLLAELNSEEGFAKLNEERQNALVRMRETRELGTVVQYRSAVANWERVIGEYEERLKKSDTARLIAIWKAQQLLHAQVNSAGDPEQLVGLLEDLRALAD